MNEVNERMKTSTIAKIGISMLVMLIAVGTASADGGSSYSSAELISVPDGDIDIWTGDFTADDWYQFTVNNGDDAYIDLDYNFAQYGGEMKLYDDSSSDIEAWVSSSHNDHTADLQAYPKPRIEINAGSQFSYKFIAGLNI